MQYMLCSECSKVESDYSKVCRMRDWTETCKRKQLKEKFGFLSTLTDRQTEGVGDILA